MGKKLPREYFWRVKTCCNCLLESLTGHKLEASENKFTSNMIERFKNHRLEIAKSFDSDTRELIDFRNNQLIPSRIALDSMIEIIDEEIDTARRKREMIGR